MHFISIVLNIIRCIIFRNRCQLFSSTGTEVKFTFIKLAMISIIKLKKGRMTDVTEADTNGQKHSESKAGYNIQDDVFQIGKRGHTA